MVIKSPKNIKPPIKSAEEASFDFANVSSMPYILLISSCAVLPHMSVDVMTLLLTADE